MHMMQMENSATNNGSHSTKRNTNNNDNSRSISMSSDSLDFFYSPYPFDSPPAPAMQPPITASSNHVDSIAAVTKKKKVLSYLATTPPSALPLPLPPPPPPPPPPAAATSAHLMMLSCWNEERVLVGGGGVAEEEVMGSTVEGRLASSMKQRQRQRSSIKKVKKVALGLRICQVILCFLSLFVMISDKTRGWTGDSYYRYPEYRYLVGVNIVGCIHSAVEACDMSYSLLTGGKHVISSHRIRYYLDFFIDQIVAYLLMSATSAAATRKSEWVSNWGKDEFTNMANASISLSFMAFFAFAVTCLFSALFITT